MYHPLPTPSVTVKLLPASKSVDHAPGITPIEPSPATGACSNPTVTHESYASSGTSARAPDEISIGVTPPNTFW